MSGTRLRTKTKLNLFLRVLGLRPDRYHELESIFHGIDLADEIHVALTDSGGVEVVARPGSELRGDMPLAEENTAMHAAMRLIERGAVNRGLKVEIVKNIPIGAGLGGGSGNAAGVLSALNELWEMDLPPSVLQEIAMSVGADVPYCLGGGTALATARGEKLTLLAAPVEMWFVLGISHEPLLTRDVYAAFEEVGAVKEVSSAPMTLALGSGDPEDVATLLHNDLEPAAFSLRPELEGKKETMARAGALGSALTGSGPTIYGVARNEGHAGEIARSVEGEFDRVVVTKTSSACVERLD